MSFFPAVVALVWLGAVIPDMALGGAVFIGENKGQKVWFPASVLLQQKNTYQNTNNCFCHVETFTPHRNEIERKT